LNREETFLLAVSLKKLTQAQHLRSIRFFGKIYGTQSDYLNVEAEPDENSSPNEEFEAPVPEEAEEPNEPEEEVELTEDDPAYGLPSKPKAKKTPKYEPEVGSGVNKYAYFVCTQGNLNVAMIRTGSRLPYCSLQLVENGPAFPT